MAQAELVSSKKRTSKMANLKRNGLRLRAGGLAIDPVFCPVDVADPFDTVQWDVREPPPSKAKMARCCSSKPTAKCRSSGANSPRTWSSASISMAKTARPSENAAFAS